MNHSGFASTAVLATILVALLGAASQPARAQRVHLDSITVTDTSLRHEARLRDGSRLIGRIVAVSADSVSIAMQVRTLTVARHELTAVRQFGAANIHGGEYWPENPNPTRLLFSATAYPLARGEGYFWNAWLFLNGFAVGVTDRITIGGGLSLLPGVRFDRNAFYVTPKVTLTGPTGRQIAVGALAALVPGLGPDNRSESLGILYGVSTFGTRDHNVSAGLGWGYVADNFASKPIVMLGGQTRMSRRTAFVSENWLVPDDDGYDGIASYGIRFLGEKLSVDLAFVNPASAPLFPGIPWLGFAVKF